jgi:UDP-glucose 4-epimerase
MRAGKTPVIFGDGSQTRDFTYVKDVVRALQLAMKSDYHGILNVGTGKAYSFNDVIEILNQKLGLTVKPKYAKNPIKNYVMHTLADISKAEREIGFKAQSPFDKGIDAIIIFSKG